MANLATDSDLEARLGRSLTAAESARSAGLLADASALIRGYTRQTFDQVLNDVITLRPVGVFLRLPQRPVQAVDQVVAVGCAGQADITLPSGSWCWDGIDLIEVYPLDSNLFLSLPASIDDFAGPDTYKVTYDHGYATIPADVVAVASRMVLAALLAPTMVEGLVMERIGQYSYQYGQQLGAASPGATVRMTDADREALAPYRRTTSTVAVHIR